MVNVSSIVAFAPSRRMATYAASKAALHSYTRTLRLALARAGGSPVKVFELVPPLVDTGFSRDVGGAAGIPPAAVAQALVAGMEKDEYEIRVGRTEELYRLSLRSPEDALLMMNPAAA